MVKYDADVESRNETMFVNAFMKLRVRDANLVYELNGWRNDCRREARLSSRVDECPTIGVTSCDVFCCSLRGRFRRGRSWLRRLMLDDSSYDDDGDRNVSPRRWFGRWGWWWQERITTTMLSTMTSAEWMRVETPTGAKTRPVVEVDDYKISLTGTKTKSLVDYEGCRCDEVDDSRLSRRLTGLDKAQWSLKLL